VEVRVLSWAPGSKLKTASLPLGETRFFVDWFFLAKRPRPILWSDYRTNDLTNDDGTACRSARRRLLRFIV
jgi:hypothetical protein